MDKWEKIYRDVLTALSTVIDPETGSNVVRMRLITELEVHEDGTVEYLFRPSSPLCPIALPLVMEIIDVIKNVKGVTDQKVTVVNYSGANELNEILASLPLKKKDAD